MVPAGFQIQSFPNDLTLLNVEHVQTFQDLLANTIGGRRSRHMKVTVGLLRVDSRDGPVLEVSLYYTVTPVLRR